MWKRPHLPHIAFRIDDLAAIGEGEVVYGPLNATVCLRTAIRARMAFVDKSGGLVENMQGTKLDTWRGEPMPWTQAEP